MGVYMNSDQNPDIFTNDSSLSGKNQDMYKKDFLADWREEQHSRFLQHHSALENVLRQQKRLQSIQYRMMEDQLADREYQEQRSEEVKDEVINLFHEVTMQNVQLQADYQRAMEAQWQPIWQAAEELKHRLDSLEQVNEELANRLEKQVNTQEQMAEQAARYEETQKDVLLRLDNQEGLIDKIARKLDHLRSVLFERTHFLAEKIEAGTLVRSKQIVQGSERSLTLYKKNDSQEDKN